MAHADAYGKRYDVCRRLCSSIAIDGRAMLRVLVEALSEHERTHAPDGAEHVVARRGQGSACIWRDRVFLALQRLFHVKHQSIG